MKHLIYVSLIAVTMLLGSCNVSERIVFNEDMGGRYESVIDLSQMMALGGQRKPADPEKKKQKMDTLVVFNDILETYRDSIATLPAAERKKIESLKDMSMQMKMDEDTGEMVMTIAKDFEQFKDIERIAYDMDAAFDSAKKTTPNGEQASQGPASQMMSMDKVIYTFTDNTFRRTDPKSLSEHLKDEGILSEETKLDLDDLKGNDATSDEPDEMMKGMMAQMGEELSKSKMKLEYVFPRKVVSVSPEGATISEDGKTVTFEVDWKTLLDGNDRVLENFEVVLED